MEDNHNLFGKGPEEQLQTVNNAIYTVLKGGQSYRIGSKQLTRADLELLFEMQSRLQAQIQAGKESSLLRDTYVAVFDRR
ncbi:MAG: peptidylprolyl isomerase [Hungatella sp.]|jgi:hypothetical protein|nr:peptidylprolyl isomerase [Hungatella sp.]